MRLFAEGKKRIANKRGANMSCCIVFAAALGCKLKFAREMIFCETKAAGEIVNGFAGLKVKEYLKKTSKCKKNTKKNLPYNKCSVHHYSHRTHVQ